MDIVLVPGPQPDGAAWEPVATMIKKAGHRPHPLAWAPADQVAAVVSVIDTCSTQVLLVGHAEGAGIAYAALDARPDRVVRLIMVDGSAPPPPLTDPAGLDVPVTIADSAAPPLSGDEPSGGLSKIKEVERLWLPADPRPDDLAGIILGSVPVTGKQFVEAGGTGDWRLGMGGAGAHFTASSFGQGLALATKLADLADGGNRRIDVDLRREGVTVTLDLRFSSFIHRDIEVARRISAAAGEVGMSADPSKLHSLNIMFHPTAESIRPFWQAALGWDERGEEDLADPLRRGPNVQFFGLEEIKPGDPQFHLDVTVGHDVAEARVAAVVAAGGRLVNDKFAPFWWTLADAEGNLVDIATGVGREEHWGWPFAPDDPAAEPD
ncbi:VOC family protein [Microlunatus speluncae]|uniref:VOC family protein n=1 Tax=Microlunatus speluncae TaxID=2594267 RepID=UPI001266782F|nr:VOC family protein [Microlunatus speluncae]